MLDWILCSSLRFISTLYMLYIRLFVLILQMFDVWCLTYTVKKACIRLCRHDFRSIFSCLGGLAFQLRDRGRDSMIAIYRVRPVLEVQTGGGSHNNRSTPDSVR